ncbi:hypothetical protein SAMD00019534_085250 [Acytostelium subglobosum LB1]|uniref:hypothetical protein n=1 Tax=Acytostelium subglobosum LB1 TaxID=1410327 RepID=UPI000644D39D|nr:hypothetical protein SAMD00019534_085250 [Acytostelium subglobosum LB1]GAM25350.1 hypothetical protein SAMD00019534_085250 [Acytostelium subglobosum LB1]|eukprot:XP_012751870.1 hypothetical protein SAMD00019534_085250 [Acytostelium subglobosum LB1]
MTTAIVSTTVGTNEPTYVHVANSNPTRTLYLTAATQFLDVVYATAPIADVSEYTYYYSGFTIKLICDASLNCSSSAPTELPAPLTPDAGPTPPAEGASFTITPAQLNIKYRSATPADDLTALTTGNPRLNFTFVDKQAAVLQKTQFGGEYEATPEGRRFLSLRSPGGEDRGLCNVQTFMEATDNVYGLGSAWLMSGYFNTKPLQLVAGNYTNGVFFGTLGVEVANATMITVSDAYKNESPAKPTSDKIICEAAAPYVPDVSSLYTKYPFNAGIPESVVFSLVCTNKTEGGPRSPSSEGYMLEPYNQEYLTTPLIPDAPIIYLNENVTYSIFKVISTNQNQQVTFAYGSYNRIADINYGTGTVLSTPAIDAETQAMQLEYPTTGMPPLPPFVSEFKVSVTQPMYKCSLLMSYVVRIDKTIIHIEDDPLSHCVSDNELKFIVTVPKVLLREVGSSLLCNVTLELFNLQGRVQTYTVDTAIAINNDLPLGYRDGLSVALSNYASGVNTKPSPQVITVNTKYTNLRQTFEALTYPDITHTFDQTLLPATGGVKLRYPFGLVDGTFVTGTVQYQTLIPPLTDVLFTTTVKVGDSPANQNKMYSQLSGSPSAGIDRSGPALNSFIIDMQQVRNTTITFTMFDATGIHCCELAVGPYTKTFYAQDMLGNDLKNATFSHIFIMNQPFCGYAATLHCVDKLLNPSSYSSGDVYYNAATKAPVQVPFVRCQFPFDESTPVPVHLHLNYDYDDNNNNAPLNTFYISLWFTQLKPSAVPFDPKLNLDCDDPDLSGTLDMVKDTTELEFKLFRTQHKDILTLKSTTCRLSLYMDISEGSFDYPHEELNFLLGRNNGNYPNPAVIHVANMGDSKPPVVESVTATTSGMVTTVTATVTDVSDLAYVEITHFDTMQPVSWVESLSPLADSHDVVFQIDVTEQNTLCGAYNRRFFVSKACDVFNNCQEWSIIDSELQEERKVQSSTTYTPTGSGPSITSFDFAPRVVDPRVGADVVFTMNVASDGVIPLSKIARPVVSVYETLYLDGLQCTMDFVNDTSMTCNIMIPPNFGRFLNASTISVNGLASVCGDVRGWTAPMLAARSFPDRIIYDDGTPVITLSPSPTTTTATPTGTPSPAKNVSINPVPIVKYSDNSFILTGSNLDTLTELNISVYYVVPPGVPIPGSNSRASSGRRHNIEAPMLINGTQVPYPFKYNPLNATLALINLTQMLTVDYPVFVEIKGQAQQQQNVPVYFCPNDCTSAKNGLCLKNGTCVCGTEWTGIDCSISKLVKCPSNSPDNLCSNKGSCSVSMLCQCGPGWNGPGCEVAAPLPTADKPSPLGVHMGDTNQPTVTFDNFDELVNSESNDNGTTTTVKVYKSSSFKVQFLSLREININNDVVIEHFFDQMDIERKEDNVYEYTAPKQSGAVGTIKVTLKRYLSADSFQWINETVTLAPNTVKYGVSFKGYPFKSKLNSLQLTWLMEASGEAGCKYNSDLPFLSGTESDIRYVVLPLHQLSLFGRFPNTVMVDGRPALVSNKKISSNTTTVEIGVEIPYFTQLDIDPDFSVLVNLNEGRKEPVCAASSTSDRRWVLIVAIVVPVVIVVCAIVAGAIYYFKYRSSGRLAVFHLKKMTSLGKY